MMVWITHGVLILFSSYGLRTAGFPMLLEGYGIVPTSFYLRYPWFESISVIWVFPLLMHQDAVTLGSLALITLMLALLVLAFIDADCYLLPDVITLPLWVMGIVVNGYEPLFIDFSSSVCSSVVAYLSLSLFASSYYHLTRRVGLGRGDIKLCSVLGAWLGLSALLWILWIACFSAVLYILVGLGLQRLAYYTYIPFGPFLVGSTWCYLLYCSHNC